MDTPDIRVRANRIVDQKFRKYWKYYLIQCSLATITFAALVFLLGDKKIVLIGAMAATCFIVFALPKTASAQTRNVVGGHLVGLASGAIFYYIDAPAHFGYPFAVGLAIFLMVILDVEHPPAAGTALAVVINEVSYDAFVTIMISAVVLSQCRYYLRNILRDLI